jgi:hypothetical protein
MLRTANVVSQIHGYITKLHMRSHRGRLPHDYLQRDHWD